MMDLLSNFAIGMAGGLCAVCFARVVAWWFDRKLESAATTLNVGHLHGVKKGQRVTIAGKPYTAIDVSETTITIEEV